jgi:hypothetical protein
MAVDAQAAPHSLYDYYNPDASVTVAPDRFLACGTCISLPAVMLACLI